MFDKVSLIIPAYIIDEEVSQYWDECQQRLVEFTARESFDYVLVNNGRSWAKRLRIEPNVHVEIPAPIGYAAAANAGIALAITLFPDNYYLVVMNVDVFVGPKWLPTLLEQYKLHGPGIVSAEDLGRLGVWRESWFSLFMTSQDVVNAVGFFDDRALPYRFHDQDYAIQVESAGFKVLRTGAVQVQHREASTYAKMDMAEQEQLEIGTMLKRHGVLHFRDRATWA